MTSEERFLQAIEDIEDELDERVNFYERKGLDLELIESSREPNSI